MTQPDSPLAQIAAVLEVKALVESLRDALLHADVAINPTDRDGISLHTWNVRLKSTTAEIRAAVKKADEFLVSGGRGK